MNNTFLLLIFSTMAISAVHAESGMGRDIKTGKNTPEQIHETFEALYGIECENNDRSFFRTAPMRINRLKFDSDTSLLDDTSEKNTAAKDDAKSPRMQAEVEIKTSKATRTNLKIYEMKEADGQWVRSKYSQTLTNEIAKEVEKELTKKPEDRPKLDKRKIPSC